MNRVITICILLTVLATAGAQAQKRVKLKHADDLIGSMRGEERFDRLIGNVVFVQQNTTIYCDSAHFFKSRNSIDAFGRVHIVEGDSVDVTSRALSYDGNKRIAYLRNNVVFKKKGIATLYTDYLDYYRLKNEARYFNGGKLVDTTNTLTSKKGYYDVRTNLASFKTNVVGVNPDYTLRSDTLQYNSKTKIIYFKDSTTIVDKEGGTAVYRSGFYNTNLKTSSLNLGVIESPEYRIKGDEYEIDDVLKLYKARGNVVMTSKEENLNIHGDFSFYDKKNGVSKVFGNAWLEKIGEEQDTLFLTADTLISIESKDPAKKRLLAYKHVKIFKTDMQGLADSLVYTSLDSTMYFYKDPILWSEDNQMTADSIRMLMKNKKVDKLYMVNNSFVVSQDSLLNFNQIKGRRMTSLFSGSKISHVLVEGNGESVYYALQEQKAANDTTKVVATVTLGLNKMICSNMRINFKQGRVNNVSAYVKPDASFIPPHEIKESDKKLKGFVWRGKERPTREQVVRKASQRK